MTGRTKAWLVGGGVVLVLLVGAVNGDGGTPPATAPTTDPVPTTTAQPTAELPAQPTAELPTLDDPATNDPAPDPEGESTSGGRSHVRVCVGHHVRVCS